ncbi:MAG: hypothetical protein HOZ81_20440 [Streptomyces sp.]|nr:hypothetical protein [Streptomyces sp.]
MGVFMKMAGLALVLGGGSLAALWLAFVNVPLAVAVLTATAGLTVAWIVVIARTEQAKR